MKKLFSCIVIGIITIPFIGDESKADYIIDAGTTWTFDGSTGDSSSGPNGDTRTLDNDLNCESEKSYASSFSSADCSFEEFLEQRCDQNVDLKGIYYYFDIYVTLGFSSAD